jgi:hypothetical protein
MNHHQNAHSATLTLITSYGHVKKPKQKGTELTSEVKYGSEEKRKWRKSSHTTRKSNYTTVFEKKM